MFSYGKVIKDIRNGKGFSQKNIYEHICTQGNYSKFELENNREVKFSILNEFLNRLEMSFEEFNYIRNNYEMSEREKLINGFYYQSYNSKSHLYKLKKECFSYLSKNPNDSLITNIYTVLKGMIILESSKDFTLASEILYPIWDDLSRRNTLYLSDIYLLNSILFIFPINTSTEIKEFAFRQIDKYKGFQNINKIKINFLINLSLINIKEKNYVAALNLLDESIEFCKTEQQFVNLSISYIRKGICLTNLNLNDQFFTEKGLRILNELEQLELINIMNKEINTYCYTGI